MGSLVRLAAITAALFVGLSFLIFAVDKSAEGSSAQVQAVDGAESPTTARTDIDGPAPGRRVEDLREERHSGARELIDDGNDLLVTPFTGIVGSGDVWVERTVPAALALLVFGFGGMLLANLFPQRRRRTADWRHATG